MSKYVLSFLGFSKKDQMLYEQYFDLYQPSIELNGDSPNIVFIDLDEVAEKPELGELKRTCLFVGVSHDGSKKKKADFFVSKPQTVDALNACMKQVFEQLEQPKKMSSKKSKEEYVLMSAFLNKAKVQSSIQKKKMIRPVKKLTRSHSGTSVDTITRAETTVVCDLLSQFGR